MMTQNKIARLLIILALVNVAFLTLLDHFIINNVVSPIILISMVVLIIIYFKKGREEKRQKQA